MEELSNHRTEETMNTKTDALIVQDLTLGYYSGVSWENNHNGVGGFEVKYNLFNNTDKTVKYVYLSIEPINAVGDVVESSVGDGSKRTLKVTGPIEPYTLLITDRGAFMHTDILWYNGSIKSLRIIQVEIEYMDGSKAIIDGKNVIIDPSIGRNKRPSSVASMNVNTAASAPGERRGASGSATQAPAKSGLSTVSIVLGGIGIVMAWLLAILGYLFGGAGLALAIVSKNKEPGDSKAKIGLFISIAALVCSLVSSIIGIINMT